MVDPRPLEVQRAVRPEYPLVSIITPSLNQGRFIQQTIESVLEQDYPNIEYIVMDGGSTDQTLDILKKYEGRLRWFSERDRGQSDAVNKGFRLAKGDILAWLNSDDTYLPGAVRKAVKYLQGHPDVGMVYGKGYRVNIEGDVISEYLTEPFDFHRLAQCCFICQPAAFWRAEVLRKVGPLDINLQYCMDYDLWMRMAQKFALGYLQEFLAASREYDSTKSVIGLAEANREAIAVVKKHYGYVPGGWIATYARLKANRRWFCSNAVSGVYLDGWASQRVQISLREVSACDCIEINGRANRFVTPMTLTIRMGDCTLKTETIKSAGQFSSRIDVPQTAKGIRTKEIEIEADRFFIPSEVFGGIVDERRLAFQIKRLRTASRVGAKRDLVRQQHGRLYVLKYPSIFMWKYMTTNHRFPFRASLELVRRGVG